MDSDSEELDIQIETHTRESSLSEDVDVPIPSPCKSSVKVLPPIVSIPLINQVFYFFQNVSLFHVVQERNETGCQTDITLVSGSSVSSFRPENLVQEISPFPPLPVISTTSAPALLKGAENVTDNESKASNNMSEQNSDVKTSVQGLYC